MPARDEEQATFLGTEPDLDVYEPEIDEGRPEFEEPEPWHPLQDGAASAQLTAGEWLVVAGGATLLVASFLPWYRVSFSFEGFGATFTANGWEDPGAIWSVLAVLIGAAMAGSLLAERFGQVTLPDLGGITYGQAYLGGGFAALLLLLLKLADESQFLWYGFYLGIGAAIVLALGGLQVYNERKEQAL